MNRRTLLTVAGGGLAALLSGCGAMPSDGGENAIPARLAATPDLSTFAAAVQAAGLTGRLSGEGPYTVFAPSNAAFARLPRGTLQALMDPANKARLQAVILNHVGRGTFTASLLKGQKLTLGTLAGPTLVVDGSSGLRIGRATVVQADIMAGNGVIHVIDRLLVQ